MSLRTPENAKFVKDFQTWIKDPKVTGTSYSVSGIDAKGRVTCSPMNLSRMGVYLWKQAVEKAGSFDVDKVRTALVGQKFKGPAGEVTMQENHHLVNNVYIGETLANGQFKVIKSFTGVAGEPFSEKFLPKTTASN
jgi:urea transport system substrate-binding protein